MSHRISSRKPVAMPHSPIRMCYVNGKFIGQFKYGEGDTITIARIPGKVFHSVTSAQEALYQLALKEGRIPAL